jgi:hypothetical protein
LPPPTTRNPTNNDNEILLGKIKVHTVELSHYLLHARFLCLGALIGIVVSSTSVDQEQGFSSMMVGQIISIYPADSHHEESTCAWVPQVLDYAVCVLKEEVEGGVLNSSRILLVVVRWMRMADGSFDRTL